MSSAEKSAAPKRIFHNSGGVISVPKTFEYPYRKGVGALLFDKMKENKDKVAQIDGTSGQKDTYEALLKRSVRTAIAMRSKGLSENDIVTVCSHNHLNTYVPIMSCFFLGIKFANIDPVLSLDDAVHLLTQVRPKMIFASAKGVKLVEDTLKITGLTTEIVVFGDTSKHTPFSDFLVASPEEEHFEPVVNDDMTKTAAIFFSSGTSGLSKGICLKQKSMVSLLSSTNSPAMVFMSYSAPYWVTSTAFAVNTILTAGCRIVLPKFDCDSLWTCVEKYKVNSLLLTPTQAATVCQRGLPKGVDISCLKTCSVGGSPLSKEQIETMRKLLSPAFFATVYSQTELGTLAIYFDVSSPEDIRLSLQKPTSCGRPRAEQIIKIVDPETEAILGFNQEGELRVKSDYIMNGYYNLDSSNEWDSDGFLKTGDIAYYDEDYCFFIVDRIKEMLKFQGWQIPPAKLEAILLTHPAVASAAVVGLPHPVDGDHPTALVTIRNEYVGRVTPEEIQVYVDQKVNDKQKLRGGVRIVNSIPVTPTDKVRRRFIRDMIVAGKMW